MISALPDLLSSGVSLFGQGARILKLRFSEQSGIPEDTLLPHRITGEESLSQLYRYTLDCLSVDTHLELKELLGQPIEVAILLPEGGERLLTGLVTRAEQAGADGGFAKYVLTIEPALATLAYRRNSRVFQDKSVPQIVETILNEHGTSNPAFNKSFQHQAQLSETYPIRSYCLQYRETDLAFIQRLLAEEGISYRFTHGPDPKTSLKSSDDVSESGNAASNASGEEQGNNTDPPLHTLILFDANHHLPENGQPSARFHRTDGIEADDAIDQWNGSRQIHSSQTQLASYDYKAVTTHTGTEATYSQQSDPGADLTTSLEDYDPQTGYYGDPDDMARYTKLRQQAKDLASKTFQGEGTVRSLHPGTWFELQDHPIHDQDNPEDREFLVTGINFEAENNLTPEAKQSLGGLLGTGSKASSSASNGNSADAAVSQNRPPYRNSFTTVRRHVPIVPEYTRASGSLLPDGSALPSGRSAHQKPTAGGLTTATVVGPEGEEIFTDEHGRIKIQFHWQRTQDHPEGGADLDDHSSTWVRVAMPSAGATWGTQYIPRIGQEVVIDFIEGDIDRPIVTGVVYNGTHRPPTFSGAGSLPANKTLSGVKSKEYKGSRYNELLFDDTTKEIRTKLSSEHGKTQLNQGFLIHPRTDGKGEPRGEGFELRTDNHGTLRAAQGLFLTTEAQNGATGKQIARDHAQSQAEAALDLTKSLAEVATKQLADTLEHGPEKVSPDNAKEGKTTSGHLQHHIEALKAWEDGTNTDKAASGAKDGKETKAPKDVKSTTAEHAEAGRQPIMILSAPAGISALTGQNLSLATGTNLDFVAQRDTNQTSGRRWLHNVGEHISLFVNGVKEKISMKLIAAQGKVQMQAQHGDIEVTADKDVTITSCKNTITIAAKEEILPTSGGGYIRIKGGNIEVHCPGKVSVKGATHLIAGPDSMNVPMPKIPGEATRYDEQFKALDLTGAVPIRNMPFSATVSDGRVLTGVTDHEGKTPRVYGSSPQQVEVAWGGLQEGLVEEDGDTCDECC